MGWSINNLKLKHQQNAAVENIKITSCVHIIFLTQKEHVYTYLFLDPPSIEQNMNNNL